MELIKHRVSHYWAHRAEDFETQRLREFESEKKAAGSQSFRSTCPRADRFGSWTSAREQAFSPVFWRSRGMTPPALT